MGVVADAGRVTCSVPVELPHAIRHVLPDGSFSTTGLDDDDPPPPITIAIVGYGELATSVGQAVSALRPQTITMVDDFGTESAWRTRLGYDHVHVRGRLEALVEPFDLAIVASSRVEPDRGYAELLCRNGVAQLYVRGQGPAASVGPLVVPGRTACLHCVDHTIADVDPWWALTLLQLSRASVPLTGLALAWAGATAAHQAHCYLRLGEASSINGILRMSEAQAATSLTQLHPHPRCSCGVATRPTRLHAVPAPRAA